MKSSKLVRTFLLVLSGGLLIQVTSCGTILAPLGLGLAENYLLSFLFGGALTG